MNKISFTLSVSLLSLFGLAATASTEGRQPPKKLPPVDCSLFLGTTRPPNPAFRPNDAISRQFIAGGFRFFLLEVKEAELKRFLTELVQIDSTSIPQVTEELGLIPVTASHYRYWLQTPNFSTFAPLPDRELKSLGGRVPVASQISPKRSVYVIVDAAILNDRPWAVYNDLSLRGGRKGNIYDELNPNMGYAEMVESVEEMTRMQASHALYRGRFVIEGSILKRHVLGFLVQPVEPELSNPLKQVAEHMMDDRLVVIESNDLDPVFHALQSPDISYRLNQIHMDRGAPKTEFQITRPWPSKGNSLK